MSIRDVQAVITASGSVRHGRPYGGSAFRACTCPKVDCGAVADGSERDDCPEHRRNPVQLWHWSAECPQVLAAARTALRRGLAVFPLPIGGRVPERGWQRQATLDETLLPELLAGRGVGIGCRASQVVALDLDVHGDDDGPGVLAALADRLGEAVPTTFAVATPSGGRHLYFRVLADCTIGSTSGGRTALGSGIDVRGPGRRSGGYLVGPGSVVGGRAYAIVRDVPVAPLPDWIAALLHRPE
ncbi:bifunctional DNA primase/polymerase [Streptomyces sp. H10-C2]|uniref:bifunctional DNA primase/polymerase n=1 Tax=unclassified Streptomyces TaxID=2593676 RepID=UPI0024B9C758|nr:MULTISPECIES: bifunctional DNA primase/polymerase [unclassified Streptomyces]MDJ0345912.1 bifunctional DNA primase/polymerase [Streptomyces sp. PH10-H1]MDJ0374761.1 bifunctional DNA primase/polymerase [Streptomyces sp. H10-C2]